VVEAVAKGRFHLYAVEEVDQAIELLFGRKAYWVHDKVREVPRGVQPGNPLHEGERGLPGGVLASRGGGPDP
ncbi:hypothetical protein, partial [Thermus scotoductus]|uniref:hypothetical protein n=1 Tax=Thermus scotoductus TaxID=37636 RepID=UPI00129268E2